MGGFDILALKSSSSYIVAYLAMLNCGWLNKGYKSSVTNSLKFTLRLPSKSFDLS